MKFYANQVCFHKTDCSKIHTLQLDAKAEEHTSNTIEVYQSNCIQECPGTVQCKRNVSILI